MQKANHKLNPNKEVKTVYTGYHILATTVLFMEKATKAQSSSSSLKSIRYDEFQQKILCVIMQSCLYQ